MASDAIEQAKWDVMSANRILAREAVLDGYGHVSFRNPENPQHFFISRSRSPELVSVEDIMELTLDGETVGNDDRPAYLERFIPGPTSSPSFTRIRKMSCRIRSAPCRYSRFGIRPVRWVPTYRCGISTTSSATRTCS
jgi:hypothetical protein